MKKDLLGKLVELEGLVGGLGFGRDLVREDGEVIYRTLPVWLVCLEGEGLSLPTPRETVRLLKYCLDNLDNPVCHQVLEQYRNHFHAQNVLVDGVRGMVIHNPLREDFPVGCQPVVEVNVGRERSVFNFSSEGMLAEPLWDALQRPVSRDFLEKVWGKGGPGVLLRVAEHLGKSAKFRYPRDYMGSVWLGCYLNLFYIYTYNILCNNCAVRGVFCGVVGQE